MADGMIFWLAPNGGDGGSTGGGWLRVVDGRIVQRGEGSDWRSATGLVALPADDRAMLAIPVGDVALHWIACPGMTVRQGAAAAPLMALESSIGPAGALHAAVLPAAEPDQPHLVAVADRVAMERWLAQASALGVPDAVLIPAALLLPPPEEGFIAGPVGAETVLRGTDCAVGAAEPHAAMIVADAPVRELDGKTVEEGLIAALLTPPLDLRQGSYAVRRASSLDPAWLRRIGVLAGVVALLTLVISLVTIMRLNFEASSLDARTLAVAREVLPDVKDVDDAQSRLAARVAARGGNSFTGIIAGVMVAMQGTPGVTMTSLSQLADGSVRVQLSAPRPEDINLVLAALQNAGWRVAANGVQQQGSQTIADISVVGS
ncbi:MAG TPA: type II secretion system protein GspL [Sphingobium sp.]|uniref:type II secretion system protein GspL n=1 Tax=Sphingobium sp. TaxID=1912891 RepID=UPI002ED3CAFB